MKRKRTKTKETNAKNVNRKSVVDDADPSRLTSHASRSFIHIACIVFLVIIVYSNTLNAPFQIDEYEYLVNNPIVKDLHYFASPSDAQGLKLYGHLMERYIGYLTFALNYKVHGFSVSGYHIVNISIHVANSVLVYLLVLLTFRTPFFLIKTDSGQAGMTGSTESQKLSPYLPCHSGLSGIDSRPLNDSRFTFHDSRSLIAFFSAVLFAVHPLQTEAVTYVFQRLVPLVAFFYLLSLTAYVRSRLAEDTQQRLFFYCISLISAVLAMKTKEIAFTLPFMITLYEFCFFKDPVKKRARYLAPMLLTLGIIPLTLLYLKGTEGGGSHYHIPGSYGNVVLSRSEYMLTEFRVIVTYLRLLFFPVNQNIDYDYPIFKSFFDLPVILSFLFLSALFGLGVYLIRTRDNTKETDSGQAGMTKKIKGLTAFCRHSVLSGIVSRFTSYDSRPLRLIGYGILWFFIALSVESSIIPLDRPIEEYRAYLPSVGVSIAVVAGLFLIKERLKSLKAGKAILVSLVLAAGVLAIAAYERNDVWGTMIKLWEDTARKSPNKENAHDNLGTIYESLNMPDKAVEQYLIAIRLKPDFPEAHYNLGVLYKSLNMYDKAIEQYLIAIKLKPDLVEAHNNLGLLYQALNIPDKAMSELQIAATLRPNDAQPHFNLGTFYYRLGQMENARKELMAVLKIEPDNQRAQQLLKTISR